MFNKSLNNNQFLYNAIKLWNDILPDLKLEKSQKKKKFKHKLKEHYS